MALLRFFKVPKHQRYDYKPRFYDPKKEELQKRLKEIEGAKKGEIEATKSRISNGMRRGYARNYQTKRQQMLRSNMILLGVVLVLLLVSYLFLTKYLPQIVQSLEGANQI